MPNVFLKNHTDNLTLTTVTNISSTTKLSTSKTSSIVTSRNVGNTTIISLLLKSVNSSNAHLSENTRRSCQNPGTIGYSYLIGFSTFFSVLGLIIGTIIGVYIGKNNIYKSPCFGQLPKESSNLIEMKRRDDKLNSHSSENLIQNKPTEALVTVK